MKTRSTLAFFVCSIFALSLTASAESLYVKDTGVVIGATTPYPNTKLHVAGATRVNSLTLDTGSGGGTMLVDNNQIAINASWPSAISKKDTNVLNFTNGSSDRVSFQLMLPDANSNVAIVNGWIGLWGNIHYLSDASMKSNIKDVGSEISQIMKLRPVSFTMLTENSGRVHFGFVAQEIEKVYPTLVAEMADPNTGEMKKGVTYMELLAPLVRAVQEQELMIEQQQAIIDILQARVSKLEGK